jgi:hypothetical protein
MDDERTKRVVVVGGSFAGRRLERLLSASGHFDVTLVDAKGFWEYHPAACRALVEPSAAARIVKPQVRRVSGAVVEPFTAARNLLTPPSIISEGADESSRGRVALCCVLHVGNVVPLATKASFPLGCLLARASLFDKTHDRVHTGGFRARRVLYSDSLSIMEPPERKKQLTKADLGGVRRAAAPHSGGHGGGGGGGRGHDRGAFYGAHAAAARRLHHPVRLLRAVHWRVIHGTHQVADGSGGHRGGTPEAVQGRSRTAGGGAVRRRCGRRLCRCGARRRNSARRTASILCRPARPRGTTNQPLTA